MKLHDWLGEERGRLASMAAHFGVSMGAVSQWKTGSVPVDRMRAVRDYTAGAVSIDDMLPESTPAVEPAKV